MSQITFNQNNSGAWWPSHAPGQLIMLPCGPPPPVVPPPPVLSQYQTRFTGSLMPCDIRIGFLPPVPGPTIMYPGDNAMFLGTSGAPPILSAPVPLNVIDVNGGIGGANARGVAQASLAMGVPPPGLPIMLPLNTRPVAVTRRTRNNCGPMMHTAPGNRSAITVVRAPRPPFLGSCGQSPECSATSTLTDNNSTSELCCSVCLESYSVLQRENRRAVVLSTCYHVFCQRCIETVMHTRTQCPKCRQPMKTSDPYRLLFF